jgi:putative acetyltransferase
MPTYSDVIVRCENIEDAHERSVIRFINEAAFGGSEEADLVESLRTEDAVLLSLVAEVHQEKLQEQIVGHILFSRMFIENSSGAFPAAALAPMAVLPEHQRRGIGGKLIRRALGALRERGEPIVIVVGHPHYYPRFGFSTEKAQSLEGPFPREAFMAMELSPGALEGVRGKVRYPAAFGL